MALVQQRRRRQIFQKNIMPWLFIAPILLLHLVVVIGPSLAAFYYSLTDWSGFGPAEYVGLENFRELLADTNYRAAIQHNASWLAFFLTVPFLMALVAAALLAQIKKGGMAFRSIMFIPYILPSVIIVSIWRNLLSPRKIDGANRRQEFWHITVPGILPTLAFMLLMTGIWSFLVFDYVWLLTQGGPAGASEVMATYLYKQAFSRFEAGYASAIGLSMSLFAGVIISVFIFLRRRGLEI